MNTNDTRKTNAELAAAIEDDLNVTLNFLRRDLDTEVMDRLDRAIALAENVVAALNRWSNDLVDLDDTESIVAHEARLETATDRLTRLTSLRDLAATFVEYS